MFETIVALATPPLKAALAIIRLSGDDCFNIVSKCFTKDIRNVDKRSLYVGSIVNEQSKIDDVVVAVYKNPHSFTGEDCVEITCHGSMLIANQIIEVLLKNGARMATNGEFSSRAYLNEKVDLIQAEAINDLINSTTIESKNVSLLALDKKTSNRLEPIRKKIMDLISLIAVNIDYPEYEDIEVVNKEKISLEGTLLINNIQNLLKDSEKALVIKDGLKVAIVGEPNVGKSTLLNALLGYDKAIVTDIAGTTRDVVEGDVNFKGITLHLFDTAGIRKTSDVVELIGVNKSFETILNADIVLLVLDEKSNCSEIEEEIVKKVSQNKIIVVSNKKDINKNKSNFVKISAKNGDLQELFDKLSDFIGISETDFGIPALNNTRQISLLKSALENIKIAVEKANQDEPADIVSYSLMSSYNNFQEILGETNQTDLVKEVFSRFCLGK